MFPQSSLKCKVIVLKFLGKKDGIQAVFCCQKLSFVRMEKKIL